MTPQAVAQTIQFIIAPVVMVTSCALLLNGVLSRYAAINDRLRLMTRERWEILRSIRSSHSMGAKGLDPLIVGRLSQIDTQVPELLSRHRLLRNVVLIVYCAIATFIVSMILIAFAALIGIDWIATTALATFLVGTIVLLAGAVLTAIEVSFSHRALDYEVRQMMMLGDDSLRS